MIELINFYIDQTEEVKKNQEEKHLTVCFLIFSFHSDFLSIDLHINNFYFVVNNDSS
jgi:hypothetical protein